MVPFVVGDAAGEASALPSGRHGYSFDREGRGRVRGVLNRVGGRSANDWTDKDFGVPRLI